MPPDPPKVRVPIPEDLREFLSDVHSRIEEGDESATTPSDDLLQCESAYGGLDEDGKRYSFVYFPGKGTSPRWEFRLLADEIEQIAGDFMDELTVRQFEKP